MEEASKAIDELAKVIRASRVSKWEYLAVNYRRIDVQIEELDKLGDEGWELISSATPNAGGVIHYLKRKKTLD